MCLDICTSRTAKSLTMVSFLRSRLGAVRSLKLARVVDETEEDIFSYASFPVEHWPKI